MGAGAKVTCLNCGITIQSLGRHHMDCCNCPDEQLGVCIDGGDSYQKMSEGNRSQWEYTIEPELIQLELNLYQDWEDENPPRVSKGSLPKMGVDGKSVKLLARLIPGKKKEQRE